MAYLDRDQVKQIVTDTLKVIADVPDANIDNTSLAMLNDQQKQVFLSTLKNKINAYPYQLNDGTASDIAYYDAPVTMDTLSGWSTVGNCIDWITANQIIVSKA